MDWWSELWLNEGFATWVGWLAIDHLYPGMYFNTMFGCSLTDILEWNVWGQFVVRHKSRGSSTLTVLTLPD
jgi:aminopeptidase N